MKSAEFTFRPALMLMSGRAAAFAVTFFIPPILARIFTQTEFGTYKQFLLVTYTLYQFGQLGLAECLFYFLPSNPDAGGRYAFNSFVMLGAVGLLFSTGLVSASQRVADWLSNPALDQYLLLAGLYLIFMLMGTVLEITMICRKRFRLATASYVVSDILRVLFLLIPAVITRNLEWTFIGGVTFCVIRFLAILVYLHHEFSGSLCFDAPLLRKQLAYALPFTTAVAVQLIQSNYHQYAVAYRFDAATFAIYSVGCLQIPLIDFMATPASNVMMVQMGEHIREGRADRLLGVWHDTTRKLALVFFPLVGLLAVNAFHLITLLYTKAYAASVRIFMVWSLSILFAAFQTDGVLRVFAQNRWLLLTNVARLAAIAGLIGWFLSSFNLIGAVLVTLSGMLIAKLMMLARIKRLLHARFVELLPWKSLGAVLLVAMLSAVPPLVVNANLNGPAIVVLLLAGMAYVITYAALALSLGVLSEGERQAIWTAVVPSSWRGFAGFSPRMRARS